MVVNHSIVKCAAITKPAEMSVYLVLCMHSGNNDRRSILKVDTIAHEARVSSRTARRALASLEDAGLIAIKKQYRPDGRQKHNAYYLLA